MDRFSETREKITKTCRCPKQILLTSMRPAYNGITKEEENAFFYYEKTKKGF